MVLLCLHPEVLKNEVRDNVTFFCAFFFVFVFLLSSYLGHCRSLHLCQRHHSAKTWCLRSSGTAAMTVTMMPVLPRSMALLIDNCPASFLLGEEGVVPLRIPSWPTRVCLHEYFLSKSTPPRLGLDHVPIESFPQILSSLLRCGLLTPRPTKINAKNKHKWKWIQPFV